MSSFVGHSLAGLTIGVANQHPHLSTTLWKKLLWMGWLMVVAVAPDLDYIVPFLHPSAHEGIRITHSIFFSSLFPIITLAFMQLVGTKKRTLIKAALQLFLASLSHIGLDLLVGVTALPIFWPLSREVFKLPFGLLPSAGKPSLTNYYFYYNLGIEMGVLLPLSCGLFISRYQRRSLGRGVMVGLLLAVSAYFMHWAYGLSR